MSRARDLEQRAAHWVLRQEEAGWSTADQHDLDRWLAESDSHKAAFWRLEHGWREADRIGSLGASVGPSLPRPWSFTSWQPIAIAASLLLVFAAFAFRAPLQSLVGQQKVEQLQFATAVGGHRLIALSDGSRVELNTNTLLKAAIGRRDRSLWLERGEAYFEVAKQAGTPFVIHVGRRTVSVVGTKFSISRDDGALTVAVTDGVVRVADGAGPAGGAVAISAGDVAVTDGRTMTVTHNASAAIERLLAWRSGRLQFDDATLAEAAAQFNRYNRRQLVIEGAAAAHMRIGGSFEARNVDAFARLLRQAYGLDVRAGDERIVVSG